MSFLRNTGFAKLIAGRKAKAGVPGEPTHAVPLTCRTNGHAYREYDTGWRCATCGNHVPRREGEEYGLVSDGRHERRRETR